MLAPAVFHVLERDAEVRSILLLSDWNGQCRGVE